jgi:hypothetical protein
MYQGYLSAAIAQAKMIQTYLIKKFPAIEVVMSLGTDAISEIVNDGTNMELRYLFERFAFRPTCSLSFLKITGFYLWCYKGSIFQVFPPIL